MAVTASVEELAFVQRTIGDLRLELRNQAIAGVINAGFADTKAGALAAVMTLMGAAQLVALELGVYSLFKSLAQDMALSEAAGQTKSMLAAGIDATRKPHLLRGT